MDRISNQVLSQSSKLFKPSQPSFGTVIQGLASAGANLLRSVVPGVGTLVGDPNEVSSLETMRQNRLESQQFSMEYLELQTQLQEDNRRFTTMSNLIKARHDTLKGAINNMHV